MKRFPLAAVLLGFLYFASPILGRAEDVVYLKDGSVIHGTITEEVPGKSIKIQTKDGNLFVYKIKAVEKITHSAPAAPEESNGGTAATEAASVSPKPTPMVHDPHAKFDKFGFLLDGGIWAPGVIGQLNSAIEAGTGDSSLDYLPAWFNLGFGMGWYTNNFALKWNFKFSYQPNDYNTDWYYGGYYVGTTTESTYIFCGGTELEADLSMDTVINKDNVTSIYFPLIVGAWNVEYNISDSYGTEDFSNTTTDFGTGIGFRGFDSSNMIWDIQLVYRACSRGNALKDPAGYQIRLPSGKYLDADVSGLDVSCSIGFLM